jgi:post-segregation antitoxin (ccd killing protein)
VNLGDVSLPPVREHGVLAYEYGIDSNDVHADGDLARRARELGINVSAAAREVVDDRHPSERPAEWRTSVTFRS